MIAMSNSSEPGLDGLGHPMQRHDPGGNCRPTRVEVRARVAAVQRRVLAGALPNRADGLRPSDQVLAFVLGHAIEAVSPRLLGRDEFDCASNPSLGVIEFQPVLVL